MTEGEKLVWAAAFVARRQEARRDFIENGMSHNRAAVCEEAWAAVDDLRNSVTCTSRDFGDEHEITAMLLEMLK